MLKNILGTTGTRILNAIINLVILIVLTKTLGKDGFGTIVLIIVAITIIQLIIDLVAGSSLIYFSSRTNLIKLVIPSYLWVISVMLIVTVIFELMYLFFPYYLNIVIPVEHRYDIILLAFLNAIMLTNYNLLLGSKRISLYNTIFTIQIIILITAILVKIYLLNQISVDSWVYAAIISYSTGAVLGTYFVFSKIKSYNLSGALAIIKQVVRYGLITQIANVLHVGNKRLGLYFLKAFSGIGSVGIYGAGTQLTEGLRLIGQSISLVQFSEISNSHDKNFAKNITIKLMKFSVVLTFLGVLVLLIIPVDIYEIVFGREFNDLKQVIFALSPGVIALSANTIFSHYYSGLGRPEISMHANLIGLIFTILLAIILIPAYGYTGAAITASISYISTVVYQYFIFRKDTGTKFHEWIPHAGDLEDIRLIMKNIKSKKH